MGCFCGCYILLCGVLSINFSGDTGIVIISVYSAASGILGLGLCGAMFHNWLLDVGYVGMCVQYCGTKQVITVFDWISINAREQD